MPEIDNKVISITFNNEQFLKDVADTIKVIEELNQAASGKNIDTSGIDGLSRAFRSASGGLTRDVHSVIQTITGLSEATNANFQTGGIDALRKALENTGTTAVDVEDTITSLQQLSKTGVAYAGDLGISTTGQSIREESAITRGAITQDIDDVTNSFSMMEMLMMGVMMNLGNKAVEIGSMAVSSLTRGFRDGWGEYNSLVNSTQTILANTERYGTTMDDVSDALGELNKYADLTTYAFSDMTRNIGYFTTAGVDLEDSVTAIQGLSNVGALFGADAQAVARAGYQVSQAMSAGVIKLMDWRSMINAGMGGQALQDELITTAAVMSGTSVDAMNDYIESLGGFNASLQEGWLTSDIFLETMRKFAGQSREYYESLTDEAGNRLYSDEEIDRLVQLGETALESATKVRTFQQMMDAFQESIGSGWQQTFSLIIGNLEEAKEFWTPINDILTNIANSFFDFQNGTLEIWREFGGREELLKGLENILTGISNVLSAIGLGFRDAFGSQYSVGNRLVQVTEAFTDLTESLVLSEEELGYLRDFFGGIFEPISLVVDIIYELVRAFFNAGDAVNGVETTADGLMSGTREFRKSILAVLGYIGSILKAGAQFIRDNKTVRKVIQVFAKVVKTTFGTIARIIAAPFVLFYQIWERYNIGEKLEEFWNKVVIYFIPIVDAVNEVRDAFKSWFDFTKTNIGGLITSLGGPLAILEDTFGSLIKLFKDLFDPTVSISEAFSNFINAMQHGKMSIVIEAIQSSLGNLWAQLQNTTIGQWFSDLKTQIQNAWDSIAQTDFGKWISEIISSISDFLGLDTVEWETFWDTTKTVVTTIADSVSTGWEKIKSFFTELFDIFKDWLGISDDTEDAADTLSSSFGAIGGEMMEGQIAQLPIVAETVRNAIIGITETIVDAEKAIPDPKESKFLEFLAAIPEKINLVVDGIAHSKVIKNVKEFFILMYNKIQGFLNQDLYEQGADILTFFRNAVDLLNNALGDFMGVDDFSFNIIGLIRFVGAAISALINTFADIDADALANVGKIVDMVCHVLYAVAASNIAGAAYQFNKTLSTMASAFEATKTALVETAKAAKWTAIANMLASFAAVLITIMAVIFGFAVLAKDHLGEMLIGVGLIILVIASLSIAISHIIDTSKTLGKNNAIGSISNLIKSITTMLIVLIGVLLALIGTAYLLNLALAYDDTGTFSAVLTGMTIIFGAIIIALVSFVGYLLSQAREFEKKGGERSLNAVGNLIAAVNGFMISVVIMVTALLADIMLFTKFINYVYSNSLDLEFITAIMFVIGIVGLAIAGVGLMIKVAREVASGSTINPKEFKTTVVILGGLLALVVLSVSILILAMTGLVWLMSSNGHNIGEFAAAFGMIAGLLVILFAGIWLIAKAIQTMSQFSIGVGGLWSAFGVIVLTLVVIGGFIAGILWVGMEIANRISDLNTFVTIMKVLGISLIAVIGTILAIGLIISKVNVSDATWRELTVLGIAMFEVVIALGAISFAMSMLITTMAESGFLSQGGNLWQVMWTIVIMLGVVVAILAAVAILTKTNVISDAEIGNMIAIAGAITIASLAFILIAQALASVTSVANDPGFVKAAIALGVCFAVIGGVLIALTAISKKTIAPVMASALSILIASLAFGVIAQAISYIASIPIDQLITAAVVMGALTFIMGVLLTALTAIGAGTGGIGVGAIFAAAAAILALGGAYYFIGLGVKAFGEGCKKTVSAIAKFADALNNLKNIDVDGIKIKIAGILGIATKVVETLVKLAPKIGEVVYLVIKGVMMGAVAGFQEGIIIGIGTIAQAIVDYAPIIVEALVQIGTIFVQVIHGILEYCVEVASADFGPGGMVRTLAVSIGDFVVWLSGKMAQWSIELVDSVLEGLCTALSDENKLQSILLRIQILWLRIKQGFMDILGFPSLSALGSALVLNLMNGVIETLQLIGNVAMPPVLRDALEEAGLDFNGFIDDLQGTLSSAENEAISDMYDTSDIEDDIASLTTRLAELDRTAGQAMYNPAEYYSNLANAADGANSSTSSLFDTIGSRIRSLIGIGDDFSISDLFGDLFNHSGGGGGRGFDLSSLTDNLGGLSDIFGSFDLSGIFNTDSLTTFNLGLGDTVDILGSDTLSNPVISPVIDDTQFNLGLADMENTWHNAEFDSVAVDAGNSMLLRERSEGDATTDGATSVSYTQIINNATQRSPIEVYRDTRSLIQGEF